MSKKENQAFQQAPWRIQLQIIGKILVGVVLAALVAGVYLNVSARTAAAAIETETLGIKEIQCSVKLPPCALKLALSPLPGR